MATERGSFSWYELMTDDPLAAKRFYDAVVGWSIATDSVAPGLEYRMITRSDGGNAGGVLTLDEAMCAKGARPVWLGYLHVEDVDATVDAMVADGASVQMPPWDQPGVGRLAMVADPSGASFYLMDPLPSQDDPEAGSDVFSPSQAQHMRWNELASADQQGAIDFYTKHFGWTQNGGLPMGDLGEYKFIEKDGGMIGAIWPKSPDMPASLWTYYIGVDDIDRAVAAVQAGGGTLIMEPVEIPGGEYSANGVDPQGASFGLVGPRR